VVRLLVLLLAAPAGAAVKAAPVTQAGLVRAVLPYFAPGGIGIDPRSGYPLDSVVPGGESRAITQPTAIGMRLEVLGHVAAGDVEATPAERRDARREADRMLRALERDQKRLGQDGLLPWMTLEGRRRALTPQVAYIDNANLTVSLMSFLGSLSRAGVSGKTAELASTVLERQLAGYARLFDGASGTFWGAAAEGESPKGYRIDRFYSEHRVKTAAIVASGAAPESAFLNLAAAHRPYRFADGSTREVPAPWNGGLFQNSWNVGYEAAFADRVPELARANADLLDAAEDEARRAGRRGFLSASAVPGPREYDGTLGAAALAEHPAEAASGAESIYAVTPYFITHPERVLAWFARYGARGPFGPWDAVAGGRAIRRYYAVDQGSTLLGLIGKQGESLRAYLDGAGLTGRVVALYRARLQARERRSERPRSRIPKRTR
jgi:hypothetical protein